MNAQHQLELLFLALANLRDALDAGQAVHAGPHARTGAQMLRDMAGRLERMADERKEAA